MFNDFSHICLRLSPCREGKQKRKDEPGCVPQQDRSSHAPFQVAHEKCDQKRDCNDDASSRKVETNKLIALSFDKVDVVIILFLDIFEPFAVNVDFQVQGTSSEALVAGPPKRNARGDE